MNDSKNQCITVAVSALTQLTVPEGLLSFTCVILLLMDSWSIYTALFYSSLMKVIYITRLDSPTHTFKSITQEHTPKTQLQELFWNLVSCSRTPSSRTNSTLLSNDGTLDDDGSNRKLSNEGECLCGRMSQSLHPDVASLRFPQLSSNLKSSTFMTHHPPPPPTPHTHTHTFCPCIPGGL